MSESKTSMTNENLKQWADNWKRVGPLLEQIEANALRENDGKSLESFIPILNWVCERATPRPTSGLVEQQRWFMKIRRMQEEVKE